MSVQKELKMVRWPARWDLFSVVYVATPEEAVEMAKAGADAIIAHVGTTTGGSIGVKKAVVTWDFTIKRTQEISPPQPRAEGHLLPGARRPDQYASRRRSRFEKQPMRLVLWVPVRWSAWASRRR